MLLSSPLRRQPPLLRLSAAALLLLTIGGCGTNSWQQDERKLPAVNSVIPQTAQRPRKVAGEDLGKRTARFADYGDANAQRLNQARTNYQKVVDTYGPVK